MSQTPLVSVAIPAYRHERYIETCLASVCAQTYPELELVLIDDGSPDATFERAGEYLARHGHRFRRVVLEKRQNSGVSANSNACIAACQGEWVHLLGSDDRLYPEKVARIQQAIATWNCLELALVHTDTDAIDADDRVLPVRKPGRHADAGPDHAAYRWLFHRNLISNPSIALHRQRFCHHKGTRLEDSRRHGGVFLPCFAGTQLAPAKKMTPTLASLTCNRCPPRGPRPATPIFALGRPGGKNTWPL